MAIVDNFGYFVKNSNVKLPSQQRIKKHII